MYPIFCLLYILNTLIDIIISPELVYILVDLPDVNVSFVPETIKSGDIEQDYNCLICHQLSLIGRYSFGENISMVQWGIS